MMYGSAVSTDPAPSLGRVAWAAWLAYSHRAAGYQTQLILSLAYYLILGPSVLVARVCGVRLLDLDVRARGSYWLERRPLERTLEALERQF
jgi:hypothetical protein